MLTKLIEQIIPVKKLTKFKDKEGITWYQADEIKSYFFNKDIVGSLENDQKKFLVIEYKNEGSTALIKKDVLFINECGLCSLILQDAEGDYFRRWLIYDVIPEILKNKSYELEEHEDIEAIFFAKRAELGKVYFSGQADLPINPPHPREDSLN